MLNFSFGFVRLQTPPGTPLFPSHRTKVNQAAGDSKGRPATLTSRVKNVIASFLIINMDLDKQPKIATSYLQ